MMWTVHPARERPNVAIATLVVVLLVAWCVAAAVGHWFPGLLAGFVLVVSLQRFFFVSTYSLDDERIVCRNGWTSQTLAWGEIRRFGYDARGGILTRTRRPSRLDAFRGMQLLFPAQATAIIERIQASLPAEAR